jgi:Xaa-Pro aminopeptidase
MAEDFRPDWPGRLTRVQSSLVSENLEALVVSTPVNVAYLTGFTGSAGLLVLAPRTRFLVVDGRYEGAVRQDLAAGRLADVAVERVEGRFDRTLGALLAREGIRRAGFEAAHTTVATLDRWQASSPGVEWAATERIVERRRAVKDAGEIAVLRRAAWMLSDVARGLAGLARRNRSEREIATAIDEALLQTGFERIAFPTIVATGPLSAHPHARPTGRRPVPGDLVLLDFGGVLDGYCVDLTRMAVVGPPFPEALALYEGVAAAHAAAIQAVRPGVAAWEIDRAARQALEARGLGSAFVHSTGHGLGLEIHEGPRIARVESDGTDTIEAGMVFTIEPGAYREGLGGVRLEDDVFVTPNGCEVLTDAPRELLVV